ncbi:MAG TPA: gephyrin-like molybdotransferase Glp [Rhodanobacter sp.]|nr:gephyrin-like molybdotransferase Glp [Rhodanobacter sp.]
MIDYAQALRLLLADIVRLPAETCPLAQASGRVLAGTIHSPIALPTFDHAAMDGYALAAREPLPAGSEHAVHGSQAAGDAARSLSGFGGRGGNMDRTDGFAARPTKARQAPGASAGGAWEIMTGACLPDGLDAVVPVERTELLETRADGMPARIRLLDPLATGQNVRYAGSDVAPGAAVLHAGTTIGAAQVMLLAALGVPEVAVVRRPRVAIICTGKELQADASQPLAPGRIYNSNGPYLTAELGAAGAQVLSCDTVDDTAGTFAEALQRAVDAGAELVISTGAVSMGRHDFVPDSLRRLDAQILFHKVAMRPGRPLLCARLAAGPLILALPGTPMAVAVGLRFFVVPALRAMAGQPAEPTWHAVLDTAQHPRPGLRCFVHATLQQGSDGRLLASVQSLQQPFRIDPFAHADAWVVLGEDAGDCAAGTRVEIVSLQPGLPPRSRPAAAG